MQSTKINYQNLYQSYIQKYNFEINPCGGKYSVINQSEQEIDIKGQKRFLQNTVYSLYKKGDIFPFHSLKTQEEHLFHIDGGSIIIHKINNKNIEKIVIGKNILQGEAVSYRMLPGDIFALEVIDSEFVLLGAVCTPGWNFEDSHIYSKQEIVNLVQENLDQEFLDKFCVQKD